MEMTGEYEIHAPREEVWDALNDPQILKECLPGCEEFNKVSDTQFDVIFTTKIGPIKTTFKTDIGLRDINPPESYILAGKGDAGPAGLANGIAEVNLKEKNGLTVLQYKVDASLKGKIGQMGSRVVDAVAQKMANQFFSAFSNIINKRAGIETEALPESHLLTYRRFIYILITIIILGILAFLATYYS